MTIGNSPAVRPDKAGTCPFEGYFPPRPAADDPLALAEGLASQLAPGVPPAWVPVGPDLEAWLFTRYADVKEALAMPEFSSNPLREGFPFEGIPGRNTSEIARSLVRRDAPDHTRLRRMVTREFMPKAIDALQSRIYAVIERRLDAMEAAGSPVDFVQQFALPVPSEIIGDLLNVPDDDHEKFQRLTRGLMSSSNSAEAQEAIATEFAEYCRDLAASKREAPSDDITTRLVQHQAATSAMTDEELSSFLVLLVAAGHDTTSSVFALSVAVLISNPHELQRLRSGEADWSLAVEELVRYLSVVRLGLRRVATADVTVGGHQIKAGEGIIASIWAANYDPQEFGGDRATFRIPDERRMHMGFGSGSHQCLGQNLARAELIYGLPRIFERFPDIRLDTPLEKLDYRHDNAVFGVTSLPVSW